MDGQLLLVQVFSDDKMKASDEKMNNIDSKLYKTKALINKVLIPNQNSSPDKMKLSKAQDPTTVIPSNKKTSLLEDGHSAKIGVSWNLKHDIILPKLYELLIKT